MDNDTSCEEYGHIYTIGKDPEIFDTCTDCGESRQYVDIERQQ